MEIYTYRIDVYGDGNDVSQLPDVTGWDVRKTSHVVIMCRLSDCGETRNALLAFPFSVTINSVVRDAAPAPPPTMASSSGIWTVMAVIRQSALKVAAGAVPTVLQTESC